MILCFLRYLVIMEFLLEMYLITHIFCANLQPVVTAPPRALQATV